MDNIDQIAEDLLDEKFISQILKDNVDEKQVFLFLELRYGGKEPLNEYI